MELKQLGEAGGAKIREALSRDLNPLVVITKFQNENQMNDNAYVLPLLDMHDIPRAQVHLNILTHLKDALLQRVKTVSQDKLADLLEKTFPYITIEELRPVVMAVLTQSTAIPKHVLAKIAAKPELYQLCPIEVKRQIWVYEQKLFEDEVAPIFNEYLEDRRIASSPYDVLVSSSILPKKRREQTVVQRLVQIVGKSIKLYSAILVLVRARFVKTNNTRFCTLRSELLMALHDAEISEIYNIDPCHKFAWCWDACIRDGAMEARQIKEMQACFDAVSPEDAIIGDLGMIINDPYATGTILKSVMDCLRSDVEQECLPKDDAKLASLCKLLEIGQSTYQMIQSQKFGIPKKEKQLLSKFCPLLASVMVDDKVRKLTNEDDYDVLPEGLVEAIQHDPIARKMTLFYILDRVIARDVPALRRALPFIETFENGSVDFDATFYRTFVTLVVAHKDDFSEDDIRLTIIEDFLVKFASQSSAVHQQLLRLLLLLHTRLADDMNLIETLRAVCDACLVGVANLKDENPFLHKAYTRLVDKIYHRIQIHEEADFLFQFVDRPAAPAPKSMSLDSPPRSTEHSSESTPMSTTPVRHESYQSYTPLNEFTSEPYFESIPVTMQAADGEEETGHQPFA